VAATYESQELADHSDLASVQPFDSRSLISISMRDADWQVELDIIQKELKRMTREDLRLLHEHMCEDARNLMKAKNVDYATESDIFRNFRMFGELGILVRMSDKLARLRSIMENGRAQVSNESINDTLVDIINYAVIYAGYIGETNVKSS
jgi:hypothetical protein